VPSVTPPAAAAAEQDEQLVNAGQRQGRRHHERPGEQRTAHGRAREAPHRLEHDRNDHRLDAVEQRARHRQRAPAHVRPGQRHHAQHRRHDEADATQHEPPGAGPQVAEVDRHLGGVGPGDQVGDAEEVDELRIADPAPAPHELLAHHRDVGRRPAEGHDTEAQEHAHDFP